MPVGVKACAITKEKVSGVDKEVLMLSILRPLCYEQGYP